MPLYYDQLGREIYLSSVPKKIISVVPSQTELLFDLGLDKEIIGITKFCIHPAHKITSVTKVGGTKQLNLTLIKALKPDLIIANKEENDRSQIEELEKKFPVWISDIDDLTKAIEMIKRVGELVEHKSQAEILTNKIGQLFNDLNIQPLNWSVAYLIWRKPYMAAGKKTFIDSMLQACGFTNAFNFERYPEINRDMLIKANPHIVFLSSEPYPFKQKYIEELKHILPKAKVMLVDGEVFSWYGSRLLNAPAYFKNLITKVTSDKELDS